MNTPIDQHEGKKYLRTIHSAFRGNTRQPISVDVYCVLNAFDVKSHAVGHAIKKLLCAGQRGKGGYRSDLVGAIAAISRAIDEYDNEMYASLESKESHPDKPDGEKRQPTPLEVLKSLLDGGWQVELCKTAPNQATYYTVTSYGGGSAKKISPSFDTIEEAILWQAR